MKIDDEIRNTVVFLAAVTGEQKILRGTGFLVSVHHPLAPHDPEQMVTYLVTAKHNIAKAQIEGCDTIQARCNGEGGGVIWVDLPFHRWVKHFEAYDDVAVIEFPTHKLAARSFHESWLQPSERVAALGVGLGHEVFMVGLFARHFGMQRNSPVVRVGTVSCMPEEPIRGEFYKEIEGYIIEARSLGGLSGSPVLFHHEGYKSPAYVEIDDRDSRSSARSCRYEVIDDGARKSIYLLGLIHGHWDARSEHMVDIKEDSAGSPDGAVNMGMAIVVPSQKIIELLYSDELVERRRTIPVRETLWTLKDEIGKV